MLPPTYYDPAELNLPVSAALQAGGASGSTHAWKDGSFSFHDILDALNPLQHIPIVDTIYRWLTGDEPGNVARIVGDGLYGGPIGLGVGLLSTAFEAETGKDPGEALVDAVTGEDNAQVKLGAVTAQPAAAPAAATATPAEPGAIPVVPGKPATGKTASGATAPTPSGTTAAAASTATTDAVATSTGATSTGMSAAPAGGPMTVPSPPQAPMILPAAPHPFMPLYRSPPSLTHAAASTDPAGQAFTAENAAFRRSPFGQRATASTAKATVPLVLSGPQLPVAPSHQPIETPGDIPQRMLQALDKYARLKQQQDQQLRGQQVDVAP